MRPKQTSQILASANDSLSSPLVSHKLRTSIIANLSSTSTLPFRIFSFWRSFALFKQWAKKIQIEIQYYTHRTNVWSRWPVFEVKCLCSKGQLISKADWCAIDSPKKQIDEFVLFAFLLFTANK